jgi:hypothetical protein
MTTSYLPGTTPAYPDIKGGQLTQTNGNPPWPCTQFTGPVTVGSIWASDGSNTLAGVAEQTGTANAGFAALAQSCVITQATNNGSAGQFVTTINIPAQSQILAMYLMVTAAWSGTTTLEVGSGASATAFTASQAVNSGLTGVGQVSIAQFVAAGTQAANWDNVGTQDVQIVILSGSTGNGVGTFTVLYIPMINLAS